MSSQRDYRPIVDTRVAMLRAPAGVDIRKLEFKPTFWKRLALFLSRKPSK